MSVEKRGVFLERVFAGLRHHRGFTDADLNDAVRAALTGLIRSVARWGTAERQVLESALRAIREFCITNSVNCFLVEQDTVKPGGVNILGELADLRFVHVVNSRTTVRDRPGKLFTAYMLDISQYTGERRRRELELISFWDRRELDKVRRSKYVLPIQELQRDLESESAVTESNARG